MNQHKKAIIRYFVNIVIFAEIIEKLLIGLPAYRLSEVRQALRVFGNRKLLRCEEHKIKLF